MSRPPPFPAVAAAESKPAAKPHTPDRVEARTPPPPPSVRLGAGHPKSPETRQPPPASQAPEARQPPLASQILETRQSPPASPTPEASRAKPSAFPADSRTEQKPLPGVLRVETKSPPGPLRFDPRPQTPGAATRPSDDRPAPSPSKQPPATGREASVAPGPSAPTDQRSVVVQKPPAPSAKPARVSNSVLPTSLPGQAPARPSSLPAGRSATHPPSESQGVSKPALAAPRVPAILPEEPLTLELTSVARALDAQAFDPQALEIEADAVTELDDGKAQTGEAPGSATVSRSGAPPHRSAAVPPPPQRDTVGATTSGRKLGVGSKEERRAPGRAEESTLAHELEAAFGAMTSSPSPSQAPIDAPPSVHELFDQLAANHLREVRDFVINLKWNESVPGWIEICQPAVASLLGAARQMEKLNLCASLEAFDKTLRDAARQDGSLSTEVRTSLIEAYARVAKELPETFSVDAEATRREAVIVHSLLQQVRDVTPMTIEKLYAAGLNKIATFSSAKPEEVAQTTGVRPATAAAIVDRFRSYRKGVEEQVSDAAKPAARGKLTTLTERLKPLEEEYEKACEGWSDDAVTKKRQLRQERTDLLLEVKVVLARLGELEVVSRVERAPFREKIAILEAYLRRSSKPQDPAPPKAKLDPH